MTYIERVLANDESIIHRARLHWIIYLGPALLVAAGIALVIAAPSGDTPEVIVLFFMVGGITVILSGVVGFVVAWVMKITTEIAVTNRRVIVKRGLILRKTMEINAKKIESMQVDQSISGRILDFGTVIAFGTGSGFEPMRRVADPLKLRGAIGHLQSQS